MKKIISIASAVILVIILGMSAAFFLSEAGLKDINPEICLTSAGSSVEITKGKICYYLKGPENGELIVLVHGFSTPKFVFDKSVDSLVSAGFRVLAFDHFGRGFSDRPNAKYDKEFFDTELLELLKALNIRKPVYLAGYSLGGGVVALFASRHPEMVKKIALIAPLGYRPPHTGMHAILMIPVLGDWIMAVFGRQSMISNMKKEADAGIASRKMLKLYIQQFEYRGITGALLSTLRNFPFGGLDSEYKKLGALGLPVLLLWGEKDDFVPFEGHIKIAASVPGLKFIPVKGADHAVTYSHAEIVNRALIDFFTGKKM